MIQPAAAVSLRYGSDTTGVQDDASVQFFCCITLIQQLILGQSAAAVSLYHAIFISLIRDTVRVDPGMKFLSSPHRRSLVTTLAKYRTIVDNRRLRRRTFWRGRSEVRFTRTTTALVLLTFGHMAQAAEVQIPVEENARFYAISREGSANRPILSYRREGSSGTTYGKREFDCKRGLTRYLAYGDTAEMSDPGYPDPQLY